MDPPPLYEIPAGLRAALELRKGEDDQRAAVAGAQHAGEEPLGPSTPADRHGDVLPTVDAVGRRAAVVTTPALELPEQLPGAGVQRVELARRLAGEHQVATGSQHRRAHRELVAPAPLLLAIGVERADGPDHVLEVHRNACAPV